MLRLESEKILCRKMVVTRNNLVEEDLIEEASEEVVVAEDLAEDLHLTQTIIENRTPIRKPTVNH